MRGEFFLSIFLIEEIMLTEEWPSNRVLWQAELLMITAPVAPMSTRGGAAPVAGFVLRARHLEGGAAEPLGPVGVDPIGPLRQHKEVH